VRWLAATALLVACGRVDFAELPPADASVAPTRFHIDSFTTTGDTFVPIPGATLQLPAKPGTSWLLLTNALLESTMFTGFTVEARYLVDDVERGIGGSQNSVVQRPGMWQHFYVMDGATPHTVRYELRDASGGTATIEQLDVVAIALPSDAVTYRAADDIIQVSSVTPAVVVDLAMGDLSGDYVGMLLVNASDAPGLSNVYVQWRDGTGALLSHRTHQPREPWQSFRVLQRMTLEQPDMHVQLFADVGDSGQLRYARALAVRADAFADVQFAADTTMAVTVDSAVQPGAALALAPTPSPAPEYVVATSLQLQETCTPGTDADRHIEVAIDGAVQAMTHTTENCTYTATYGTLDTLDHRPANVTIGWSTLNGIEVEYDGSQILALGLR
jgi:hypothetical protein